MTKCSPIHDVVLEAQNLLAGSQEEAFIGAYCFDIVPTYGKNLSVEDNYLQNMYFDQSSQTNYLIFEDTGVVRLTSS